MSNLQKGEVRVAFLKLIHTSVSQQQKTTENPTSSSALH